uniref:Uncharacterized protein n=1 Tax=Trichogramma kaykai TaxID=54128 RepID=A0ABD2WJE2_9HYME
MAKMFSSLRLGTLRSRKARPGSVAAGTTTSPNTTMTNCNNTTMTSIVTTTSGPPCGDSTTAQDNALLQQQQQYMSSGYFVPSFLSLDELSESAAVGCSASPTSVASKVAQVRYYRGTGL